MNRMLKARETILEVKEQQVEESKEFELFKKRKQGSWFNFKRREIKKKRKRIEKEELGRLTKNDYLSYRWKI